MLNQGKIIYYEPEKNNNFNKVKELSKLRKKLSKNLASIKAMIRNNIFAKFFPEIDSLYKEIDHPEIITILKNFPAADKIKQTNFNDFRI